MATQSAEASGTGERVGVYSVPDTELAVGSTLGGPKLCLTLKATGAIEKIYSIDAGEVLFGTLVLHHWDERTGIRLSPLSGKFLIHPEHQEHLFELDNGVGVHEKVFVLSGEPQGHRVDPPAAYYSVRLHNRSTEAVQIGSYAFCQLRGHMNHDVLATYDKKRRAIVAWNEKQERKHVRTFGLSVTPTSFETTVDHAKALARRCPGLLSNQTKTSPSDPLGIFHLSHLLLPGESAAFDFLLSFSCEGRRAATRTYASCPPVAEALERTREYYRDVLSRSVVVTPDTEVNRGVLWAKANMLRTELLSPTGWSFVNDPMRSNNSVGRDTAWFGFGADYVTPQFAREALLAYVERQEPSGMIVEYYDIRNGKTADYDLNINDNTPLVILALWHHYATTGDEPFLTQVYPAALKAARYILSQLSEAGLVRCTSTGTSDWGIVGWRNVIANYRLSGATTELNSECFAALRTISHMARALKRHEEAAEFGAHASALREAINAHLYNPANGLYYLNIEIDGEARSDITSDLVFPVMFGVASEETAARIISSLTAQDFWTEAGIRTVPRSAPNYGPTHGYGLLGGVWVAVTFWFAFAAARFSPEFMAFALATSFRHYSRDPQKNNTVPGQFSEWLHGETLVNQGMMLSPWFPPRYLWAAIEGAGGLDLSGASPSVNPRLAPDWKWLGVQNLPFGEQRLTWFVVRTPDVQMYTNFRFQRSAPYKAYDEDISVRLHASGHAAVVLGFREKSNLVLFTGNTVERTVTTAVRVETEVEGSYRLRSFHSLRGAWVDEGIVTAEQLRTGLAVELERKGFAVLELEQET